MEALERVGKNQLCIGINFLREPLWERSLRDNHCDERTFC